MRRSPGTLRSLSKAHRRFGEQRAAWDQCLAELRGVLERFDAEIADLDSASAQWLREELCQQFELEVLRATRRQRRDVLAAALKHLEVGVI